MDKKLLVAESPQLAPRLVTLLAPQRALFVHTLDAATKALAERAFDAVLIGMHFDESRMFELLAAIGAGERNRNVPVLCYRLRPPGFAAPGIEALEAAVQAQGARAFVDLASLPEEEGKRQLAALVASLTGRG